MPSHKRPHASDESLVIKPVPIPVTAKHPPPPRGGSVLPHHEFTMGLIAPKGSGKTTTICNILDFMRGYFHMITIISPTLKNDEKWLWVRRQALLAENKALRKFMERHNRLADTVVGKPTVLESDKPFDPKIPEDQFMTEYDEDVFKSMIEEQNAMIDRITALGGTKHLAYRWLVILDDLVGSKLFNNRRQNPFKMANTNHRHISLSMLQVSQAYREIPKTVRTNWTCLILFEIANDAEVKTVYEEYSMGLKFDEWLKVYQYCTEGDFDFMYINVDKPKRLRIMKNFDQYVFIDRDEHPDT